ncbi:MAG: ACP S-malonyltransferase [Okeania sp. SIO3I5]|uniref:ACP S-malonyltransferase n=1 Tax=Okeania sp. SIO3I5 TaxID=2607805 RepID=UPI0013B995B5|nr:ACP S-malonyltransferase [Okeania sp. SIO3I5]NEQ35356.1 ACP S-malonyltransferase [Okeania sp. SIO3I5]
MTKTAWVFPGQGSQKVGMGIDLLDLPSAKAKFDQAHQILGWSVTEICQKEEAKLSQTIYTQPCLYVVESILADEMLANSCQPNLVAGHSLGEYVALYVAGVFDFETGLKLVKKRAELMNNVTDGEMTALIGFDGKKLEEELEQTPDVVLANDNDSGQVVISGTPEAIKILLEKVKAKRAIKLNVSGAFHSPLMESPSREFQEILESVEFADAKVPVISNFEPTATTDAGIIKKRLEQQMTNGVRWRETSLEMEKEGVKKVIEIGPGKVLSGLIKRVCSSLKLVNVSSLQQCLAILNKEEGKEKKEEKKLIINN